MKRPHTMGVKCVIVAVADVKGKGVTILEKCRICGEILKLTTGTERYGAKVHLCPRCKAPYIDPKIIELATVPERARASHRMRYAKQMDQRMLLIAAAVMTIAMHVFASTRLAHGFFGMLLMLGTVYAGLNVIGFCLRYFVAFPRLTKDSVYRMNDGWYLARLRSAKAA